MSEQRRLDPASGRRGAGRRGGPRGRAPGAAAGGGDPDYANDTRVQAQPGSLLQNGGVLGIIGSSRSRCCSRSAPRSASRSGGRCGRSLLLAFLIVCSSPRAASGKRLLQRLRGGTRPDAGLGPRRAFPRSPRCSRRAIAATPRSSYTAPCPSGLVGVLALYTYEEKTTDSKGEPRDDLLPLHGRGDPATPRRLRS